MKEIALLHTNYFQDCLKEIQWKVFYRAKKLEEYLSRLIISILKERGILRSHKSK